jgi:hypothetical protein
MKPAVRTPVSIATACLAGAVFVPAIPAGAALRLAPVAAERPLVADGTLAVCQVTTNSRTSDSAWNLAVRVKGSKKVVAGGLVPNGTTSFPACRTIQLPPGAYRVAETQKKGQPVVQVVVRDHRGKSATYTAGNGRKLTGVAFGIGAGKITTVTFFNKIN